MGKMKQWRREAEQHNLDATLERGERTRHQGRRNKASMYGFNGAGLAGLKFNAVV